MVPCVSVKVAGDSYYPLYNNSAMFRINEDFDGDIFEKITDNTKEGFELAFKVFKVMCEEGEAVRRHYGYEKGNVPDWKEAEITYSPADIIQVKNAVFAAVTIGCGRELPDNDDGSVDLTLLEVQKKTKES